MKAPVFIFQFVTIFSVLFFSTASYAQLTVDAGNDTTYCAGLYPHEMILGSQATIKNGVEPYTIAWEAKVELWQNRIYTASHFLSDTALLSPEIKNHSINSGWITFFLNVTDNQNHTAKDSIRVRFSSFGYTTGYYEVNLQKGDSVLFHESSVGGGIEPLSYRWEPTTGLSNPDSLVTWCKPDHSTSYNVIATDSCGCVSAPSMVYNVHVTPLLNIVQEGTTIYFDNPNNQLAQIILQSIDGQKIGEFKTSENYFNTFQIIQNEGNYLITVSIGEKTETKKITIQNSLLSPNNLWSVLDDFEYVHVHPNDPYSYSKSTWYKIGEDTTIHEVGYKKLMKSTDPNHENWQPEGHFLRQEGDQIYSKDGANTETLLYNFGMAIGDSMETEIYPRTKYISILDSIGDTTMNNTTRKIYYLREFPKVYSGWKTQEIWIEGIGSITDGLLRHTEFGLTGANHGYQLLCFHQNETLIYQSQDFDNCYINSSEGNSNKLIVPGKTWTYFTGDAVPVQKITGDDCYHIGTDTLISSTAYNKLIYTTNCDKTGGSILGYIRETSDSMVYFRWDDSDEDILLYDFGMNVGDSILYMSSYFLLDSIKTNSSKQKIYYLSDNRDRQQEWIESVGSKTGLLNDWDAITGGIRVFNCCLLYEKVFYHNPEFQECYFSTGIEQLNSQNKLISVFVNSTGHVEVRPVAMQTKGLFQLYTINGEILNSEWILRNNAIEICPNASGILIYRLTNSNGEIQSGKLFVP